LIRTQLILNNFRVCIYFKFTVKRGSYTIYNGIRICQINIVNPHSAKGEKNCSKKHEENPGSSITMQSGAFEGENDK